MITLNT